jgi:hypothetical protein
VQFRTFLAEHYGFQEQREAKFDPITDIFRTMHVTAFGLHRLEATAPWGVKQQKQTEEQVAPSDKRISPPDFGAGVRGTRIPGPGLRLATDQDFSDLWIKRIDRKVIKANRWKLRLNS